MVLKVLVVLLTLTFLHSGLSFEYVDDITEIPDPNIPHLLEFERSRFPRDDLLKNQNPADQEISSLFNSCQQKCWSNRCFCKLFAIAISSEVASCFQHSDVMMHVHKMWDDTSLKYFKVYKWKPKYTVSAVDGIVKTPKLLEMPALNKILSCYGISPEEEDFKYDQRFLTTCGLALNSEDTETDFFDWIGKDISEFKHLSNHFNSLASASISRLETGERSQKRPRYSQHLPEAEFKMLKFLNIFSRQMDPELFTVYDPTHGIIFFHLGDISILVVVFGPGDIVLMRFPTEREKKASFFRNVNGPVMDRSKGWERISSDSSDDDILMLFNAAIARFPNNPKFQSIGFSWTKMEAPTVPDLAFGSTITYLLLGHESSIRSQGLLVFYKELQEATLQLWDKKHPQSTVFKERLATRQKQSQFLDTMIITQSE